MAKQVDDSPLREAALEYAVTHEIPVFPLHGVKEDGSCTCGRKCGQAGKHPRTANGHKDATLDVRQIEKWWKRWPDANIGAVGHDLLCLDVDVKRTNGLESLEQLIAQNAPLPETATAETGLAGNGMRGRHYWFTLPEGSTCSSAINVRDGIDLKTGNGYAILPPSMHATGVRYEWIVDVSEMREAPDWLIDLMPERLNPKSKWTPPKGFRMAKATREFLHGRYEPDGDQRGAFVAYARAILASGVPVFEAGEVLWAGYDGHGGIRSCENREPDWPWTEEDAHFIVETVYRTNPPPMRSEQSQDNDVEAAEEERDTFIPYDNTDADNGRRLVDSYDDQAGIFHVTDWNRWYIWDGTTWAESSNGIEIEQRWLAITREMYEESGEHYNRGHEETGKKLLNWTMSSRQRSRVVAAVEMAKSHVAVEPKMLNADDFLLNVRNGVLDLRTGEVLAPDPDMMLTKRARVEYIEGAQSDLWDTVLEEWIPDEEMRLFVQKAFGYTLTGSTDEHKFFFFHGPPGSGKTTLVEALKYLMGNYAETAETETFMLGRPGSGAGPSEDLARLSAARMVVAHEAEEGSRFAEAKLSHLTGGDTVTARFLHQNSFEFNPKFKLFFTANHKPRVSGSSQSGLWRRLVIVPVDRVIPEEERDPLLSKKLRTPEVMSAILAWALEGCSMWVSDYEDGRLLHVPDVLKEQVEEYRSDADHLYRFLQSGRVKVTGEAEDRAANPAFYEVYQGWCVEEGVPSRSILTKNSLTRKLTQEHGLQKGVGRVGKQYNGAYWEGVKIPLYQG